MDQKRLLTAIVLSIAILLGFQLLMPKPPKAPPVLTQTTQNTPTNATPPATGSLAPPGTQPTANVPDPALSRDAPRLRISASRVQGTVNLMGAYIDDLVLRDFHEEVSPDSKLVRLLEPRVDPQPYYVQYGWSADGDVKIPTDTTIWTASAPELTNGTPVTLSWDNGQGQVFEIVLAIDDYYMFTAEQRVRNTGPNPVKIYPWAQIHRDYKPVTAGSTILHEGFVGMIDGSLKDHDYNAVTKEAEKHPADGAWIDAATTEGWGGINDKYWFVGLIPDQAVSTNVAFRHFLVNNADRYQVDIRPPTSMEAAPGATAAATSHLFVGAKELYVIDKYKTDLNLPAFDKAIDFGWFYPFTKWISYALDWLYRLTGNFGIAIMIFTVCVKLLFFPLANKSYRSMSKMKALNPKIAEVRERLKDEPQKMQSEIMGIYKTSGANPVSGCLPMVIQIPVFFSLYKVISISIEMRHAPFFGWIHDLSAVDPTNVFNLFGLIPFDPGQISHFLHLGIWPLIMGVTMFLQQKLNPPPPDPVQAKLFQFMPIIFTFMLSGFPAGLVIYWSWNNLLTIAQQWTIMRRAQSPAALPVRT